MNLYISKVYVLSKCESKWFWWKSHEVAKYFDTHVYMFNYDYDIGFHLMVMLRSTTGSYGRPVIEVAYGEMIFHSTETVWEMLAREELRPYLTYLGQHQCGLHIYIFWFSRYKNLCICILFSKFICSIKEYWWSLTLSWPDKVQKIFSTVHDFLKENLNHGRFYDFLCKLYDF